jgi:uncharacterized membrane protein YbaN (DUF454 family)
MQTRSRPKLITIEPRRLFYGLAGCLFVGLAALGTVLPLLPTTPFVLVAAACFARSSSRAHAWLLGNRVFGPLIRNWQRDRSVSLRAKVTSIALIIVTIGSTVLFAVKPPLLRIMLCAIGLGVITFLVRLRTTPVDRDAELPR